MGQITCGRPILRSKVPALCNVHLQKAHRALKKAGLPIPSSSKLAPKFHVIVAEYVQQIQAKRRAALRANGNSVVEVAVDAIGCRSLSIVERGQGLRRAVLLVGFEVCWLVAKMWKASLDAGTLRFMGRLSGSCRGVAVWVRREEEGGSSIQIVVMEGKRRAQLFFPMSAFGDGWGDLALAHGGGKLRHGCRGSGGAHSDGRQVVSTISGSVVKSAPRRKARRGAQFAPEHAPCEAL
ncbi:hypothetical protein HYC85_020992 [Camellia sinensis]|uniref:Uncharacterized protein n=1 Tax=Camellia sinensis TaxID=4442 RepID=A0A7J7GHQ8_CAMSI|nr:hypothetical protein HYC85_020992 [Camellia sinensis]